MNRRPLLLAALLWAAGPLAVPGVFAQVAPPPPSPAVAAGLRFHEVRAPDGVPLNVVEAGRSEGPALLLLHGYSQSYLSWWPQLSDPALTARYRVVAMDLRGHGASGKPWTREAYAGSKPWADDVRAVVEALQLARPLLVGWSFGGYVAMDYVREYGAGAVAGVMLAGSNGGLAVRSFGTPTPFTGDLDLALTNARRFMSLMAAKPLPQDAVDRGVAAALMLPPYVRNAGVGKRLDNSDLVAGLDVPLLAVLGGADPSVPIESLRQALAGKAQARIVVYDGVGHSAFAEQSTRFNADLATFAGQHLERLPEPVARYVAAVNAGDADGATTAFAPRGVMRLLGDRDVRGHAAIREIEAFHAAVRPTIAPLGWTVTTRGTRTILGLERNVEISPMFTAMGLPRVTTEPVADAFVVRGGAIESARQPQFAAACRSVMGAAMPAFRAWLERNGDARLGTLYDGARPRIEAATAPAWIEALNAWRAASGWQPDPTLVARCAG